MRVRWGPAIVTVLVLAGCTTPSDEGPEEGLEPYRVPESPGWGWQPRPDMPVPVSGAACTVFRGEIWAFGGLDGSGAPTSWVSIFDPESGKWGNGQSMTGAVHEAVAFQPRSSRNTVLIAGGYEHQGLRDPTSRVLEYNLNIGYTPNYPHPLPRPWAEAVLLDLGGRWTLVGGTHDGTTATPRLVQWTGSPLMMWEEPDTTLAAPRADGAFAMIDQGDVLVATGGWSSDPARPEQETTAQALATGRTAEWPGVPTPRTQVATATWDDRLFLAGGVDPDGNVTDAVEFLDLDQEAWFRVVPLGMPVRDACAVVLSDGLHIFGGRTADGSVSAAHWVLQRFV